MRTRLLVLGALLLVLPLALAGVASAQAGTGELELNHDRDTPASVTVGVIAEGQSEETSLGSVAAGDLGGFELPEGDHRLSLYDGDGTQLLRDYAFSITGGQTLELYASQLLGDEAEEEDGTGTLVFRHDLDEPATVAVGILYEGETEEQQLGTVPDNDARGFPARVGTHLLAVYDPDGTQLLRGYEVTITRGQQTSVSASDLLGGESDDSDADAGLLIFYNDGSADLTLEAVEVASGDRIDLDAQVGAGNSGQVTLPTGKIRVLAYRADDDVFAGEATVTITSGGRTGLDASDLVTADDDDEIRTPTRVDTGAGGTAGTGVAAVVVPTLLAAGAALAGSRALRRAA